MPYEHQFAGRSLCFAKGSCLRSLMTCGSENCGSDDHSSSSESGGIMSFVTAPVPFLSWTLRPLLGEVFSSSSSSSSSGGIMSGVTTPVPFRSCTLCPLVGDVLSGALLSGACAGCPLPSSTCPSASNFIRTFRPFASKPFSSSSVVTNRLISSLSIAVFPMRCRQLQRAPITKIARVTNLNVGSKRNKQCWNNEENCQHLPY
mmetsp:Transcript_510/g.1218  ORF Transcript_510/g.1218 Transcript_510/m.1218 type:complete len:203 (+) Transcript_510:162-770(+)